MYIQGDGRKLSKIEYAFLMRLKEFARLSCTPLRIASKPLQFLFTLTFGNSVDPEKSMERFVEDGHLLFHDGRWYITEPTQQAEDCEGQEPAGLPPDGLTHLAGAWRAGVRSLKREHLLPPDKRTKSGLVTLAEGAVIDPDSLEKLKLLWSGPTPAPDAAVVQTSSMSPFELDALNAESTLVRQLLADLWVAETSHAGALPWRLCRIFFRRYFETDMEMAEVRRQLIAVHLLSREVGPHFQREPFRFSITEQAKALLKERGPISSLGEGELEVMLKDDYKFVVDTDEARRRVAPPTVRFMRPDADLPPIPFRVLEAILVDHLFVERVNKSTLTVAVSSMVFLWHCGSNNNVRAARLALQTIGLYEQASQSGTITELGRELAATLDRKPSFGDATAKQILLGYAPMVIPFTPEWQRKPPEQVAHVDEAELEAVDASLVAPPHLLPNRTRPASMMIPPAWRQVLMDHLFLEELSGNPLSSDVSNIVFSRHRQENPKLNRSQIKARGFLVAFDASGRQTNRQGVKPHAWSVESATRHQLAALGIKPSIPEAEGRTILHFMQG